MEDRPCQPEDAEQDNEINPGKSAFDFRSTQLCRSYFHFDAINNISKVARRNNPIRVTLSRLFNFKAKVRRQKAE
jgi:hypothetical protein